MALNYRSCVRTHAHHKSQGSEHPIGAIPQLLAEFQDDHAAEQVRCAHGDRTYRISVGILRGAGTVQAHSARTNPHRVGPAVRTRLAAIQCEPNSAQACHDLTDRA